MTDNTIDKGFMVERISAGDRVTILIPNGIGRNGIEWKEKTGRAVMRGPAGWVLNMGGRYGTPGVATPENIVKVYHVGPKHNCHMPGYDGHSCPACR